MKLFFFENENENEKFTEVLDPDQSLSSIRKKLKDKIKNNIYFIYEENPISQKDEDKLTISLISNKSKIILKKLEGDFHSLILEEKHPIPGSSLICETNGLTIYKYPDIQFSKEEDEKAISFMVEMEKQLY